ncbi:MAG: AEC family transporter [Oscillospiraceae bacterium]|nr:AEC family transporter [Oscillospiraceae bacterium]
MLSNLLVVAGQVGTLFLMMAVGFVLVKLKKLHTNVLPQINFLLLYVVAPCVIIHSMQTERSASLLRNLAIGFGLIALTYVVYMFIAMPFFRRQEEKTRSVMRFGSIYGNTGFMGLPLVQSVLGQSATIYAALGFVVFNIFSWTHGVVLMGGRKHFSIKKAILNPGVISAIIGLTLFLFEIRLPSVVDNAIGFMANINTPLAMVVVGAQLADSDVLATFRRALLYQGAVIKLILVPLVTALILLPFHLDPLLYCTIVILAAAPSAGVTAMFSLRWQQDSKTAAQLITLTTLLSIITLPIFAVLAQLFSGMLSLS